MFEDATFESTGKIRTAGRRWMPATLLLNGMALSVLILFPLMHPELLPNRSLAFSVQTPTIFKPVKIQVQPMLHEFHAPTEAAMQAIFAAPILHPNGGGPASTASFHDSAITLPQGTPSEGMSIGAFQPARPVVVARAPGGAQMRVSTMVEEGLIVHRVLPQYPAIARATGVSGTVVLKAVISQTGTIENLEVVSGPQLLRRSAVEAVQQWRYRPYLLNREPVAVETTINVVFRMDR